MGGIREKDSRAHGHPEYPAIRIRPTKSPPAASRPSRRTPKQPAGGGRAKASGPIAPRPCEARPIRPVSSAFGRHRPGEGGVTLHPCGPRSRPVGKTFVFACQRLRDSPQETSVSRKCRIIRAWVQRKRCALVRKYSRFRGHVGDGAVRISRAIARIGKERWPSGLRRRFAKPCIRLRGTLSHR